MSAVAPVEPAALPRSRSLPPWLRTLRGSLRNTHMRIGTAIMTVVLLIAIFGPTIAPHSPTALVGIPVTGPSSHALLGTDILGRDVLSRLLAGGRSVVWMSFASTVLGVIIGVSIGLLAGYSRSWVDEMLMRSTDIVLAFPQIVLALLFLALAGPKLWLIVVIVAISHAPRVARLVRGVTLEIVQRDFVQAAEVIGVPRRRILTRDVLPNLMTPLMVEFGLRLTWSIGIIAGISFLGLGLQPPASDWGLMINENRSTLIGQPWAVVAPIICIAIFTIGANLMTEGYARAVAGLDREVSS